VWVSGYETRKVQNDVSTRRRKSFDEMPHSAWIRGEKKNISKTSIVQHTGTVVDMRLKQLGHAMDAFGSTPALLPSKRHVILFLLLVINTKRNSLLPVP
jgi:hypothetical protein